MSARKENNLTQEELKKQLRYDRRSGIFIRLVSNSNAVKVGDIAGNIRKGYSGKSYIDIDVNGIRYQAHRLSFLYINGLFPEFEVDHINGDGLDNSWCNLRPVTHKENGMNQRLSKNSTSKFNGVCWHTGTNKWRAYIKVNGCQYHLGLFDKKSLAIKARKNANVKYGFHKNHGKNRPL